jgi:hypothetical protein
MRNAMALFAGLLAAAGFAGCAEKASDGEISEMCKHLNKLGAEFDLTPAEMRVSKVEADYANRVKHAEADRDEALKAVDDDFAKKVAELKKDDEKAKLKADTDAAKAAKAAELQKQIDGLNAEMADASKKAEQKAKEDAAAAAQAAEKCVAENKGVGLEKKIAQCRILTMNAEDYWKCK